MQATEFLIRAVSKTRSAGLCDVKSVLLVVESGMTHRVIFLLSVVVIRLYPHSAQVLLGHETKHLRVH